MIINPVRAIDDPITSSDPISDPLAAAIRHRVADWYRRSHRKLPWRETTDPYRIWISEIMLQQTQVATVIPYYNAFLTRFPDIFSLAAAGLQEVLKIWEGLGYYARARNLHKAAKKIVAEYGGRIPTEMDAIRSLTGIGGYVAAAVLSFAYGRPHAVLDGNVKRVISRLFSMDAPVNRASAHNDFQAISDRLLDRDRPALYNQAIMELGALVCKPKNPACTECPLAGECSAYGEGQISRYPVRDRKPPVPEYMMVIGVVRKNGRFLIVQRAENGLLGGLWEFPGVKIDAEADESPETALRRHLLESVNLEVEDPALLTHVRHAYTHFKIRAEVFSCTYAAGRVRLAGPAGFKWVTAEEMEKYPFTGVARKILDRI